MVKRRGAWCGKMLAGGLVLLGACHGSGGRSTKQPAPLRIAPGRELGAQSKLRQRMTKSPHLYFRYVNREFSREVCRRLSSAGWHEPPVNLHGDAHLEQYAVTSRGRGLTDFDDSSVGPASLDLLRFGVSIELVAKAKGWGDQRGRFLDAFYAAYAQALKEPAYRPKALSVAAGFRAGFARPRLEFLNWAQAQMQPVPGKRRSLLAAVDVYAESMRKAHHGVEPGYFRIKKWGRLNMGVGSSQDEKYLFRIEGPSEKPGDDGILEAKEVRDLSSIPCILRSAPHDPFRIMIANSRIADRPYRYLGYVRVGKGPQAATFWIHSWDDQYRELSVRKDLRSADELVELVQDIGAQLGRGHPKQIASPLDVELRRALLEHLSLHGAELRTWTSELAAQCLRAWESFRKRAAAN